jgi:hypothetical protein
MYGDPLGMDTAGDDQSDDTTQPAGALGRSGRAGIDPDTQQRITDLQSAQAILAAGGGPPAGVGPPTGIGALSAAQMLAARPLASERPDATNLPLLAAAGALMRPTRTGGFAESLGGALETGASTLSKQRELEENARLRAAQLADTAAWRQTIGGARQQHEETYAELAQIRKYAADNQLTEAQARQALAQQKLADTENAAAKTNMVYFGTSDDGRSMFYNSKDVNAGVVYGAPVNAKPSANADVQWARLQQQADTAAANQNIRQQALAQAADQAEKNRINSATNAQISAAAKMSISPTDFAASLKAVVEGRGTLPGGQGAQPTQQPTALPMPKTAAEAVPGQIYNTARGPAKWDGSQFIPVQ